MLAAAYEAVRFDEAWAINSQRDFIKAVKAMVRDLNFPVGILVAPTMRDPDGLAMSSRNRYLSAKERELGLKLSKALFAMHDAFVKGERRASALEATGWRMLERVTGLTPRYLAVVNADTFTHPLAPSSPFSTWSPSVHSSASRHTSTCWRIRAPRRQQPRASNSSYLGSLFAKTGSPS